MFLVTSPIVINVNANQRFIVCRNNACYCSLTGKFEYQKKYDVNVCKQETSLYGHGTLKIAL